jgi:hypothetical protein
MYFTRLAEITSLEDFDPGLLENYEYLIIVRLGSFEDNADADAIEAFKHKARRSRNALYIIDKPGSTGTLDLVEFYEKVFGTVFEGVDWERPFFLLVKTEDLINSEHAFLAGKVEYIDDHLELEEGGTEEDEYFNEHSPAGYALREAHQAIESQARHAVKVNPASLFGALQQLWQILSL